MLIIFKEILTLLLKYKNVDILMISTQISIASFLWNIGKQCRPRSDATERGVWSGSYLFAYIIYY